MDKPVLHELKMKIILAYLAMLLVFVIFFFLPAGTFDYWQAWAYIAALFFPASIIVLYFLKNDPEFLERRLKMKEKEAKQRFVQKAWVLVFIIGFIIPGLDRRFGWSNMPFEIPLIADALVLIGYFLVFLVFKENSYAGRTIRVEKGQKVISTGPYSVMRHPMYVGMLILLLATPLALGSYWAVLPFLFMPAILIYRILNEEEVLRRELPGYVEYCEKVRWRLVPFVW